MEAESEEVLLIFFLFLCNAAEESEVCSSQSSALVTTSLGTRSHTLASHQLICCAIKAYFCTEHRQSPTVWPKTICIQAIFLTLFLLLLYPDMLPRPYQSEIPKLSWANSMKIFRKISQMRPKYKPLLPWESWVGGGGGRGDANYGWDGDNEAAIRWLDQS